MSSTSLVDRLGSASLADRKATALDQIDPDLGSIISSLSANSNANQSKTFAENADAYDRRNSASYSASDVDSDFGPFGFRRGTLSLGGGSQSGAQNNQTSRLQGNVFGAASVSGGVASHHPPSVGGRFMDKFSSIADATKEVELLGGGLGSLSIGTTSGRVPSSRRTSFLTAEGTPRPFIEKSSPGSLNESLNNPMNPVSSRPSISDKIDNYLSNTASPTQHYKNGSVDHPASGSRTMSISSDVRSEHNSVHSDLNDKVNSTNIWNTQSAATAPTFTPMFSQQQSQQQPQPPMQPGQPMSPPPPGAYPQMFPFGFPPFPFMPMMPPPFGQQGMPGPMPGQENADPSSKSDAQATGENGAESPSPPSGPHHPQPQQPQPGFNGNGQPFVYPQAFSPYGFMPPPMGGDSPLMPPPGSSPMALHPSQPQNGPQSQNLPSSNHHGPRRNGRSPKSGSPANGGGRYNNGGKNKNNQIYRSPLLEEFRNPNNQKQYSLKDIFGSAVEFSKDQHGSRFIQTALGKASDEEKEVMFNEIRDIALELMNDVFGNYVIQKYFEHGNDTQKQILLSEMKGKIENLSVQMYGCRVVQRAIEFVGLEDQLSIVDELKDSVLKLIKDQNGNHVIQKAIEKIPADDVAFILDSVRTQIYHLSTHSYGCRVIQRLLEFSDKKEQNFILEELSKYTYFLIQDQYGNYVIQHIIENGAPDQRSHIVEVVSGNVVEFSKHKFASNVVEKCVVNGTEEQVVVILDQVLSGNEVDNDEIVDDRSPLGLMMKDQYANYVVQKLVDVSIGQKRRILIKKIKQYLKQISKSSYGKHLASIEKLITIADAADVSDDED